MEIGRSRKAPAQSARDNYHRLYDPSRPSKVGRIMCQYAALRTKVSLVSANTAGVMLRDLNTTTSQTIDIIVKICAAGKVAEPVG